jgi:hypothetical protein
MQLMQFNWFLSKGVFEMDQVNKGLVLHYDRFAEAAESMLEAVLKIQHDGDRAAAEAFIERWTEWNEDTHESIAKTIRENRAFQYALFRYSALGE